MSLFLEGIWIVPLWSLPRVHQPPEVFYFSKEINQPIRIEYRGEQSWFQYNQVNLADRLAPIHWPIADISVSLDFSCGYKAFFVQWLFVSTSLLL